MRKSVITAATLALLSVCMQNPPASAQLIEKHNIATGTHPSLSADKQNHISVVFEGFKGKDKSTDIFYSVSTDGGANWTAPKDISLTPGQSSHPRVATEKSGAIDVVWVDDSADQKSPDIFFTRSEDGGVTWSSPKDLSNTPGSSAEPALAVGPDDTIHVVWSDTSKGVKNTDIYYAASTDHGKTWAKDPLLPAVDISNTPGTSSQPTLAVGDDGDLNVAWADTTSGDDHPDICYVHCVNDTWTVPVNVSNSPRKSSHPRISCDKNHMYLSWSDNSEKEDAADIWLAIGSKSGKFDKPINISNTKGASVDPASANCDGQLAVVWSDTSTGDKTPSIYARISPDGGQDFSSVMNLSKGTSHATNPHVAVLGGKLISVWEEIVPGSDNSIQASTMDLKGIATAPATPVNPAATNN